MLPNHALSENIIKYTLFAKWEIQGIEKKLKYLISKFSTITNNEHSEFVDAGAAIDDLSDSHQQFSKTQNITSSIFPIMSCSKTISTNIISVEQLIIIALLGQQELRKRKETYILNLRFF